MSRSIQYSFKRRLVGRQFREQQTHADLSMFGNRLQSINQSHSIGSCVAVFMQIYYDYYLPPAQNQAKLCELNRNWRFTDARTQAGKR